MKRFYFILSYFPVYILDGMKYLQILILKIGNFSSTFDTIPNAELPNLQFAHMEIYDIDQDGVADIYGFSAHQYGLWWFEQVDKDGFSKFL